MAKRYVQVLTAQDRRELEALIGGRALLVNGVTNGDSHDHNGGAGGQINHTTLSSIGTNTHAALDTHLADLVPHFDPRVRPRWFTDLIYSNDLGPWVAVAIATGTIPILATSVANHPGMYRAISHATNANSGGRLSTNGAPFILKGGEYFETVVKPYFDALGGGNEIIAELDSGATYPPGANSVNLRITQAGIGGSAQIFVGTCTKSGGGGGTVSTAEANHVHWVNNTFYRVGFYLNAAGTAVTFFVYSEAGALLWTETLSTYIPLAAAMSAVFAGVNVAPGGGARNICDIDYLYMTYSSDLVR